MIEKNDNEKKGRNVVTRFAPSPTGFMHVGNVRTAIFAYLWARRNNGTFILRIEDTDKAREVEGSKEHIQETLKWLGINWDEGPVVGGIHAPYIQSERLLIYQKYAQKLIEDGYAYVDGTNEEDAEILRQKAESENRPFLYREHRKELDESYKGVGHTLRFKTKEIKKTYWDDVVFGKLSAGEEALDDFVLIKSDGFPTYNFAHLVDDIEMGVTHVMRGQEFVSSTPKYLALYEALEQTPPIFVSLPHILGDQGQKKLGKRDGAKDVLSYRDEGYLPAALFNFLAFLGFNPGGEKEVYTKEELEQVFDITRIQKGGARFNEEKLLWFNKEHIKLLSEEEKVQMIKECIPNDFTYSDDFIKKIQSIVTERIATWSDLRINFKSEFGYFFIEPVVDDNYVIKSNWKENQTDLTKQYISVAKDILCDTNTETWESPESIKESIWPLTEKYGRGDILWPLRYILSGKEKSPDPFTLMYVLGKEETLKRIHNYLN